MSNRVDFGEPPKEAHCERCKIVARQVEQLTLAIHYLAHISDVEVSEVGILWDAVSWKEALDKKNKIRSLEAELKRLES